MRNKTLFMAPMLIALALFLQQCVVVHPGEMGIKQTLGKIIGKPNTQGLRWYNPFVSKVVLINIQTVEVFNVLPLPTKEGLSVNAEISLLYHLNPDSVQSVYTKFGTNYEEVMVLSNFRATAREISSRYFAKELYATERNKVERAIAEELTDHISKHGFVIDAVLLKDIILPPQMVQAIQEKVNAEQLALKMEYIIQQAQKEAERKVIEAEGIKKSQLIISESITQKQLDYNQIEMLKTLVNSPNSKIIITDGKTHLLNTTN